MYFAFLGARAACLLPVIKTALIVASASAAAADVRPLAFDEALRIGELRSARLTAQQAAVDAASEQVPRAGELPDPRLRLGVENVPVSNPDAFSMTRDSMTMRRLSYMQEMPNSEKREARGARAQRERAVESASLAANRLQVQQEIAIAWLDVHYAQETVKVLDELVKAYQFEADASGPAVSSGRLAPAGAMGVRVAVETARDRALDQQRNLARTRASLAAFVGDAAERPLGAPPDTRTLSHPPGALVAAIESHPAQRVYEEREALAASEVALATSTRKPDWNWEVSFGQREPNYSNMVSVMVGIDLPLRKSERQDRDVATRTKQLEQARAQREDARRMHEAEIRGLVADWDFASERVRRFEQGILPLARERSELALAAYRGGRGELSAVLESRRAEADARLSQLAAELERARAWARLSFLIAHGGRP
jgi:outer membrane protein TolC